MPKSIPITAVLCGLLALGLAHAPTAGATTMIGGEQLNPSERSHEFYIGFPEVGYQWDFKATGQRTLGLNAGVIVWPLTFHFALATRTLIGVQGRSVVSFRADPGLLLGLYGGSRAFFEDLRWGRSKAMSVQIAPMINLGVAASIDLGESFSLVVGFESPIAVWFRLSQFGWWIEWPLLVDLGLEYDVSYKSTIFTRASLGPVIGFTGTKQFAGLGFNFVLGIQTNY